MKKLKILIVEEEVIGDIGHDICAIEATEAGAVAATAHFKPDLMIVDAGLHKGSGVTAVERILRAGFVPHIFVSGDPLRERGSSPSEVLLQKPHFLSGLLQAMECALNERD